MSKPDSPEAMLQVKVRELKEHGRLAIHILLLIYQEVIETRCWNPAYLKQFAAEVIKESHVSYLIFALPQNDSEWEDFRDEQVFLGRMWQLRDFCNVFKNIISSYSPAKVRKFMMVYNKLDRCKWYDAFEKFVQQNASRAASSFSNFSFETISSKTPSRIPRITQDFRTLRDLKKYMWLQMTGNRMSIFPLPIYKSTSSTFFSVTTPSSQSKGETQSSSSQSLSPGPRRSARLNPQEIPRLAICPAPAYKSTSSTAITQETFHHLQYLQGETQFSTSNLSSLSPGPRRSERLRKRRKRMSQ
jgi:hypothetical protein